MKLGLISSAWLGSSIGTADGIRLTKEIGKTRSLRKETFARANVAGLSNTTKTADPLPVISAGFAPNCCNFRLIALS